MKTLAEIVVGAVAFLQLEEGVDPEAAVGQLQDIGLQLLASSEEEKAAVLDVCRSIAEALPKNADPQVRAFYENFGESFQIMAE